MIAAQVIHEARRRAGLTQAELAARAGTTQSVIARLERGGTAPSLERVRALVDAAGLELRLGVADRDDGDWAAVTRNLALTPEQRWDNAVAAARFVIEGRAAPRSRRT